MITFKGRSLREQNSAFTFNRITNAIEPIDNKVVGVNQPRYGIGQNGFGMLFEEATTNLMVGNVDQYSGLELTRWQSSSCSLVPEGNWYRLTLTTNVTDLTSFSVRGNTDLSRLTSGQTYTSSIEVYNDSTTALQVGINWCDNGNNTSTMYTINPKETKRISATYTGTYDATFKFMDFVLIGNSGQSILVRNPQVEQKAYPTSFANGTRTDEWASIPTTGLFGSPDGTIEFTFTPNFNQADSQRLAAYRYFIADSSSNLRIWLWNGSVDNSITFDYNNADLSRNNIDIQDTTHTTIQKGVPVKIGYTFTATTLIGYINGVATPLKTVASTLVALGPTLYIGNANGGGDTADGVIDDIRFSNIARTNAEMTANGTSKAPLPVDANTTLKLSSDFPNSVYLNGNTSL